MDDLDIQIEELMAAGERNEKWRKSHADIIRDKHKYEINSIQSEYDIRKKEVEAKTKVLEWELETTKKLLELKELDYVELREKWDDLRKLGKETKEGNERLATQNWILKAANEELSKVSAKIQPVLDENVLLKEKINSLETQLGLKDWLIKDLKAEVSDLKKSNDKLVDTLVKSKITVVDTKVVAPQVISPLSCNGK